MFKPSYFFPFLALLQKCVLVVMSQPRSQALPISFAEGERKWERGRHCLGLCIHLAKVKLNTQKKMRTEKP